ncbi:TlpA disulfide reductase family protein [Marinifilum fragile]|uniref:TlpA family protein disulfide reductase n=1 Tax=Marinifilum fragile TaxID=570161 RepID=UPI002AA8C6EF|nr:TlpA disulfide reductase family protein [Marinifilum fragile]
MKINNYFILAVALTVFLISCKKENNEVHIFGSLKGFNSTVKMQSYDPLEHIKGEGITITTDSKGYFDITFDLQYPKYFRLGRNHLYLSPGDDVEMHLDKGYPEKAKFKGTGSQACDYLKFKPFPKGGSYLEAGRMFQTTGLDFDKIKSQIEKCSAEDVKRLSTYSSLSEQFIALEKVRIDLNSANSFKSLLTYAGVYQRKYKVTDLSELETKSNLETKKYLDEISLNSQFLQLEEFTGFIRNLKELYGEDNVPQEIKDFSTAYSLVRYLSSVGPTQKFLDYKNENYPKLRVGKYIDLVDSSMEEFKNLLPGNKAPKLIFENKQGEKKDLSDFKGKPLVIDIWATWCGPCIGETPHFEKLNEKYGNKIQFISISIDDNKKKWENYLNKHEHKIPQFLSMRANFEEYRLSGVPRFIVLDKDGNIIDAWAAKPSTGELEKLINKHI